ncbi:MULTISPECIES: hypothetical protein [unclassified Saccharothrix]|uniref:hypothetical protein n=1 Tax=unclassified Saccharothrix TaxID=2593673 RepID=UPI00307DB4BF
MGDEDGGPDETGRPAPVSASRTVSNTVADASSGPLVQAGYLHGTATAPGGYANAGVHIGDVHVMQRTPFRSRYLHLVRIMAPDELVGRDTELAELAEFCTSRSGAYFWWQGEPWAGKSALLSWFTLHPPPGVRIVSFFVTARMAGQNHRGAFIENVVGQLSEILGETPPVLLSEATRDVHLLGMLEDAAALCRSRDEQLVLLVDGLDEDRGVTSGPDDYSVAGLLPITPPHGANVVVASRSTRPLPYDLPQDHPLRQNALVRDLVTSPEARVSRSDMERELRRLLSGQRELVAFVVASGGGLTAEELAELTGVPAREMAERLASTACRSFASRPSPWTLGEMYMLSHAELLAEAANHLGSEVDEHRMRIHRWAETYRDRRWPKSTPEYLLHGYFRMLAANDDVARMAAVAADRHRIDLMREVSGSDAEALRHLATTEERLLARDDVAVAVAVMTLLALNRQRLIDRNSATPVEFPAAWAALGRHRRAAELAGAISSIGDRIEALALVAITSAEQDADMAKTVLAQAERQLDLVDEPTSRSRAVAALAKAAVTVGDPAGVFRVLRRRADLSAEDFGEIGRVIESRWGADRSDVAINSVDDVAARLRMCLGVAEVSPDTDRARRHFDHALGLVPDVPRWEVRDTLRHIARTASRLLPYDVADTVVRSLFREGVSEVEVTGVRAEVAARFGDLDTAVELVESLDAPNARPLLVHLLGAMPWSEDEAAALEHRLAELGGTRNTRALTVAIADAGDLSRAARRATRAADSTAMAAVARRAAVAGNPALAEQLLAATMNLAATGSERVDDLRGVAVVAQAAARCGDIVAAKRLIAKVEEHGYRTEFADHLAAAAALTGDLPLATAYAGDDERALLAVVRATAERGETAAALDLSSRLTVRLLREEAFAVTSEALIGTGELTRAVTTIMRCKSDSAWRVVAAALARQSFTADAMHLSFLVPKERRNALRASLARSAEHSGAVDMANACLDEISNEDDRLDALLGVMEAAAVRRDLGRVRQVSTALHSAAARSSTPSTKTLRLAMTRTSSGLSTLTTFTESLEAALEGRSGSQAAVITDPEQRERVAVALAAAGAEDTAAHLVRTMPSDYERARGWHRLAMETPLGPTGRPAAELLRLLHWTSVVPVITRHHPEAIPPLVDDLLQ